MKPKNKREWKKEFWKEVDTFSKAFDTLFNHYRERCDTVAPLLKLYYEKASDFLIRKYWLGGYWRDEAGNERCREYLGELGRGIVYSLKPGFERGYATYVILLNAEDLVYAYHVPERYFVWKIEDEVKKERKIARTSSPLIGDVHMAVSVVKTARLALYDIEDAVQRVIKNLKEGEDVNTKDAAITYLLTGISDFDKLSDEELERLEKKMDRIMEGVHDVVDGWVAATYPFVDLRDICRGEVDDRKIEEFLQNFYLSIPEGIRTDSLRKKFMEKEREIVRVESPSDRERVEEFWSRKAEELLLEKYEVPFFPPSNFLEGEYLFRKGWEYWFKEPPY